MEPNFSTGSHFGSEVCTESGSAPGWWQTGQRQPQNYGLDSFFTLGTEILVANSSQDTLGYLRKMPEEERCRIGERACRKVRSRHTVAHRAAELETFLREYQNSAAFATMFPLQQPMFRYAS